MAKTIDDASQTFEKSQEYVAKQIANSEKVAESMIELGASMFQITDVVAKKMYENYVSNMAAAFDGMKALNKSTDVSDFVKIASNNISAASERMTDQTKSVMELTGKVARDTGEAATKAYSKSFAVSV